MSFKKIIAMGALAGMTLGAPTLQAQMRESNKVKKVYSHSMLHTLKGDPHNLSHEEFMKFTLNDCYKLFGKEMEKILVQYIFEEINVLRDTLGIPRLEYDETLTEVCKRFTNFMADNQKWGHRVNGKRSKDMGIDVSDYKILSENISLSPGTFSLKITIDDRLYGDDWVDERRGKKRPLEKNHKYPIIRTDVDRVGCGVVVDKNGKFGIMMISGAK